MPFDTIRFKDKKGRHWLRSSIYYIWHFRQLFEERQKMENPKGKNRIDVKIAHIQEKIDRLNRDGKSLGFSPDQIKDLNQAIVKEIKTGKMPKEIIEKMIK